MKILIAYAGKYGVTAYYARLMAEDLGAGAEILDLASKGAGKKDLAPFDAVILGASVYAGNPRSALKKIIKDRAAELSGKKMALFLCGLAGNVEGAPVLAKTFPENLRSNAAAVEYLPGWIYKEKLNSFEAFIIRMIEKGREKEQKPAPPKPDFKTEAESFLEKSGFRG